MPDLHLAVRDIVEVDGAIADSNVVHVGDSQFANVVRSYTNPPALQSNLAIFTGTTTGVPCGKPMAEE